MSEIEDHYSNLQGLAHECVDADMSAYQLLHSRLEERNEFVINAINLRRLLLSGGDEDSVIGLLATGYFSELTGDSRIAAFVLCTELEREITSLAHERRFEPYHKEQPLFSHFPQYLKLVAVNELLPSEIVGQMRGDGVIQASSRFVRIDPYLHPAIVSWSRSSFPGMPLFLRIDPYFVRSEEPPMRLLEAILIPADPQLVVNSGCLSKARKGVIISNRAAGRSQS